MIPFRFVGQHSLVFDFGTVNPDDEFEVSEDRVEAFRHRTDLECLDSDAIEALDKAKAAAEAIEQSVAPADPPVTLAPQVVASTPDKSNAKSDDSGKAASKQE